MVMSCLLSSSTLTSLNVTTRTDVYWPKVLTRLQAIPEVLSTRTLLVFEEEDLEPDA